MAASGATWTAKNGMAATQSVRSADPSPAVEIGVPVGTVAGALIGSGWSPTGDEVEGYPNRTGPGMPPHPPGRRLT